MSSVLAHTTHPSLAGPIAAWFHAGLQRARALWNAPLLAAAQRRPLTRFEEAEQVRAMAMDLLDSDPAFAQDLFAAADRHELE
ncbi:MAG: hypothetical protein A2W72_11510 [Burkholderiales bacterium RIFCSPLOWO2_12_67_14]|nr:MAG: hypothetical protein A3I64_13080 [Burkholderiales bacterium RIFCSPLOWO2_02_FULL_67_64]OGB38297.1 MAG: hypothetical protein A3E51_23800 [Burkholderiales bacterium RIFCSPHIGHO2_12_FULL_67_38]OGB40181.1 MAG: hypothetical protein A2W72_11510 [Burkholderiales bacterium RIFCSPLOWO2_12_67_14]OGB96185.1 MAG: hypothetical protein A3G82_06775 [Burkholderiales bacterium RIFCSPLOWO2_12_FULL_67_210]